jgi:hypothetical protein
MTDIIPGLQGEIPVNHTKGSWEVRYSFLSGDKDGIVDVSQHLRHLHLYLSNSLKLSSIMR